MDRSRQTSLVEQMAERFAAKRHFHLAITPEGTRKANSDWKRGFYYIALKAQVPIVLFALDYPTKTITGKQSGIPDRRHRKRHARHQAILHPLQRQKSPELRHMTPLRITLLQTDIVWEDKAANLENLFHRLQALEGQTDLLVLPEMFSTGFSMNVAEQAETSDGPTIGRLRQWATQFHIALAGSFMARTPGSEGPASSTAYYNRAFFVAPGQEPFFQDKRHLFPHGRRSRPLRSRAQPCSLHLQGVENPALGVLRPALPRVEPEPAQ